MPKTGEPCEICGQPVKRGVPTPYGLCCANKFQQAIADWKAKEAVKNGTVPF